MNSILDILDGTRARGAFALRTVMRAPWSLKIESESPITMLAGVKGNFWVLPSKGEAIRLGPGDIAIARAPDHYIVADNPDTSPTVIVHPGQHCCDLQGNSLLEEMTHGIRTWGNDPAGSTLFLVGAYEQHSDISDRLIGSLPPVLSISSSEWTSPLVPILCEEVIKDEPGQAAVLDRIFDLLLTSVLKAWFARQDVSQPVWWHASGDPVVERALRIIHQDPAKPWTMDTLATEANASRASLARRFQEIVGEPPMTFLRNWRMALAADLLCKPGETVSTVAEKVGYQSPFAFSTAFKRTRGLSPQEHREGYMSAVG